MQKKSCKTCCVFSLLASLLFLSSSVLSDPIKLVPGQKQLFLDDYVIQNMSGLTRTMHQPEKKGAVVKPDVPSDGQMLQTRSAPMWDPAEKVYKLVYTAYTYDDFKSIGPAMAISTDGIHWTKPDLGQRISVYGSKENNRTSQGGSIIVDPDDPDPSRRFKSMIGTIDRVLYVSPDCIHWTNTQVKLASNDESNLTYDRQRRQFLAILKSFNTYGRASNIAISSDFTHWTTPRLLFGADAEDQVLAIDNIKAKLADDGLAHPVNVDAQGTPSTWKAESYNTAVFPYEDVYIGMPSIYYPTGEDVTHTNTDGFHLIQLMMTRDLVNWTRLGNRQPFIPPSRVGSWSQKQGLVGVFDRIQMFATNPLEMGDELWFYYSGMKFRDSPYGDYPQGWYCPGEGTLTSEEKADLCEGHGAICLAVLRLDGFISLDAIDNGYVQTKAMTIAGKNLYLNANASHGQAKVEILDETGNVIPGFSRQECLAITGDSVRHQVAWQNDNEFSNLAGKTVLFKIYLTNASLYAFGTDFAEETLTADN